MPGTELRVGEQGRVVIPTELRKRLGITRGSTLVATTTADGRLVLEATDNVARRSRGAWKALADGHDLVGELLAGRRAENELDEADAEAERASGARKRLAHLSE